VPAGSEAPRPFCSQRCRTIDLGSWLTGAYRLSREIQEDDLDEVPTAALEEEMTSAPEAKSPRHRRH
jgi:endogenous inhibitor of DNA gyrase (YacG/DUF329 family)